MLIQALCILHLKNLMTMARKSLIYSRARDLSASLQPGRHNGWLPSYQFSLLRKTAADYHSIHIALVHVQIRILLVAGERVSASQYNHHQQARAKAGALF
jgi:hypothetical protein